MTKSTMKVALALLATGLFASGAYAAPVTLNDGQMDSVAAGGVETTDGFVCPVISTSAVLNSDLGGAINPQGDEQYYTIIATSPGNPIAIPLTATNDDGAGFPTDTYVAPGDEGYTAIWSLN